MLAWLAKWSVSMPVARFARPRLALLLGACLLTTPAMARDISGSLAYRERIALPETAELLVQLAGRGGEAETRRLAAGQVPLPFSLATDDTGPATLRAGVFVDGKAIWTSDAIPVPEGEADLDLGTLTLRHPVIIGYGQAYLCGGLSADVSVTDSGALMRIAGRSFTLSPDPAAEGERYSDGSGSSVALDGNRARVILPDRLLPECLPTFPASLPVTLRGNEPGWVATLTPEALVLSTEAGDRIETPLPAALPPDTAAPLTTTYATDALRVAITDTLCHDTMTGMPYPYAATLTYEGQTLDGCGGEPGTLLHGEWTLASAEGITLPPGVHVTFGVANDRLFGQSGCNRYIGSLAISGEGLRLSSGGITMMACPEPLMALEQAWIALLASVDGFDIGPDGSLILLSAGDPRANLQR
jgi:heat shock protein HslJ/uncharacterized lipoprotein YbaY